MTSRPSLRSWPVTSDVTEKSRTTTSGTGMISPMSLPTRRCLQSVLLLAVLPSACTRFPSGQPPAPRITQIQKGIVAPNYCDGVWALSPDGKTLGLPYFGALGLEPDGKTRFQPRRKARSGTLGLDNRRAAHAPGITRRSVRRVVRRVLQKRVRHSQRHKAAGLRSGHFPKEKKLS